MKEQVARIGNVAEYLPDGGVAEMLPLVGFDSHLRKLFFRSFCRKPIQKIVIDEFYNQGFLRFNDEVVAVPAITINLKLAVGNALLKAFARTPLYIF